MQLQKENIGDTQIKLTVTVPMDRIRPFLDRAAKKISLKHKINGFRLGKASYDVITQQFGEMAIYQEAVNSIIDDTLLDSVTREKIEYTGYPNIDIQKLAPGNDIVYSAIFDLMPKVTLPDSWKTLSVDVNKESISPESVQRVVADLRNRKAKQVVKDGEIVLTDKVILDFELSFENVIPEDGDVKGFEVIIGENKMIPGFEDALLGLTAGALNEFDLFFPKDYFKKDFAEKKGHFKVKINHVFQIELPEYNDGFVKEFGYETKEAFEKKIMEQLKHDSDHQAEHEAEVKMFNLLSEKSVFSAIPDSMVAAEQDTMIRELQHNITKQGLSFENYLEHMKKNVEQLKEDMKDEAIKRVKSGLVVNAIGDIENIVVTEEEISVEVQKAIASAQGDKKMLNVFQSPRYTAYVENSLRLRAITRHMKSTILKGSESCGTCNE